MCSLKTSNFFDISIAILLKLDKIFNLKGIHYHYKHKVGENKLKQKFRPSGNCQDGGFYGTWQPEHWLHKGNRIATISFPDNARVYVESSGVSQRKLKFDLYHLAYDPVPYKDWLFDWVAMIKNRPRAAKWVPKEKQTEEVCKAMIDAKYLGRIDPTCRTERLHLYCFQEGKLVQLCNLNDKYRTYAVCRAAVSAYPLNLEHVPKAYLDKNMYELAQRAPEFRIKLKGLIPKEYVLASCDALSTSGNKVACEEHEKQIEKQAGIIKKALSLAEQQSGVLNDQKLLIEQQNHLLDTIRARVAAGEAAKVTIATIAAARAAETPIASERAKTETQKAAVPKTETPKAAISPPSSKDIVGPMDRYLVKQPRFTIISTTSPSISYSIKADPSVSCSTEEPAQKKRKMEQDDAGGFSQWISSWFN